MVRGIVPRQGVVDPQEEPVARRSILFLAGVLVALASSPPVARALGNASDVSTREGPEAFPLGAKVIFEQSVGAGTFIAHDYERRPLYAATLTFFPRWNISEHALLLGRLDISKEFISNASSETTQNRETTLADAQLIFIYDGFYAVPSSVPVIGGLSFGAELDLLFPTSKQSQFRSLILGVRPIGYFSWPIGPVTLSYQFRFTKNFNRYTSPVVHASDTAPVAVARMRGAEELGADLIALGGNNVEYVIGNRLTAEWELGKTFGFERLVRITADYLLTNAWTYRSYPSDELRADDAVAGRGQRDLAAATFAVEVGVIQHLNLALGVVSYQPPQTSDNKGFRAPFFNFWDLANNYTTIYFDVIGAF
jgi:hypothetical protein